MNRGLARRTIFETRADTRFFLSLLARARRRGQLEVHAYTLMSTHFHLLVRSLDGHLSETMRWILNGYVRYFNRTRRRDGPLMRGRFVSIPVLSIVYLRTLFRYIDQNAVDAGLVARPADYPYGSAKYLRRTGRRPLWLSRSLVDCLLDRHRRHDRNRRSGYDAVFAPVLSERQKAWIERRPAGMARGFDDLEELLGDSLAVRRWAESKARLADGTLPGMAVVDPETAAEAVDHTLAGLDDPIARSRSGRKRPAAPLMKTAILRDAAGETFTEIAVRIGVGPGTPQKWYRLHRECLEDLLYRDAYHAVVLQALRSLHGE